MENYDNGFWALTLCFGLFFLYTYFKGKYPPIALWIGISSFALAIWFLYESWTFGVLKEDIEMGVYYIVIIAILLIAGKITFIWRNKKRKEDAWKKFSNDDDDDYGKFLKKQREKYKKDK